MQDDVKTRLTEFLKYIGIGQAKFAEKAGLSRGFVNNIGDSITKRSLLKILSVYPDLNVNWLLTGEGEMLKSGSAIDVPEDNNISRGKLIPFYDAEAAAGTEYGVSVEAARQIGVIEIGGLLRDSEAALRIYGNSMVPNYPSGCVVGLRRHLDSFIEPGTVFVVETTDNRYLKRLFYNTGHTAYRCVSDNHITFDSGTMKGEYCYPDFEIPFEEVRKLFRVVGVIKRNTI